MLTDCFCHVGCLPQWRLYQSEWIGSRRWWLRRCGLLWLTCWLSYWRIYSWRGSRHQCCLPSVSNMRPTSIIHVLDGQFEGQAYLSRSLSAVCFIHYSRGHYKPRRLLMILHRPLEVGSGQTVAVLCCDFNSCGTSVRMNRVVPSEHVGCGYQYISQTVWVVVVTRHRTLC